MPSGKQTMYFATGIDDLGKHNNPIDPEHDTGKVFEYGGGLYLSEDKKTAKEYATRAFLKKIGNSSVENDKIYLNWTKEEVYLYEFEVNFDELDKYSHFVIRDNNVRNEYIYNVIEQYKVNENYRPSTIWTYGPLCGLEWDNKVNYDTINNLSKENIDECLRTSMDDNQLCIHKRLKSSEIGNMQYLNNIEKKSMKILTCKDFVDEKEVQNLNGLREHRCYAFEEIFRSSKNTKKVSGGDN